MPLVTLKAGATLDGRIAAAAGRSRWITGPLARRVAHRLRWAHDAIVVGAGTIRNDDPQLTVRLAGARAPRWRVVLASTLELDPRAAVFREAPGAPRPRVYTGSAATAKAVEALSGVADVVRVPESSSGLELVSVLRDLVVVGVQSVLVEGGGRTHAGFLAAGLAQRIALFVAPTLLGARGTTPLVDLPGATSPAHGLRITERRRRSARHGPPRARPRRLSGVFTGLVETVGRVVALASRTGAMRLTLASDLPLDGTQVGASVAVDGVCLTVAERTGQRIVADVVAETLARSTLGELRVRQRVNLERALRVGDRLGGHLVAGHVDDTAGVRAVRRRGADRRVTIALRRALRPYVAPKGSIALDGVSLTVAARTATTFEVVLVPRDARAHDARSARGRRPAQRGGRPDRALS